MSVIEEHPYEYRRLAATEHIRLIKLFPSWTFASDLHCDIQHVSKGEGGSLWGSSLVPPSFIRERTLACLPRSQSYEAVSYTWGEQPVFSRKLWCGGVDDGVTNVQRAVIYITESLECALRRFRQEDTARYLWVDAVCINQADVDERGQQVPLMSDIYAKASDVLVWLGEDDSKESDGWLTLGLCQLAQDSYMYVSPEYRMRGWYPNLRRIMENILRNLIDDSRWRRDGFEGGTRWFSAEELESRSRELQDVERLWRPIQMFFTRPWFTRRWVLQEVINASHATFYCGEAKVDAYVLVQAASWFQHPDLKFLGLDDTILESVMQMQSMMWGLTRHIKGLDSSDILELLYAFQANDCSDDRDRVFALLGLVDQGPAREPFDFPVNYHQSPAMIFIRLARQLLEQRDTVDILAFAGAMQRSSNTKPSLNLPSWVPDWRFREKFKPVRRVREPLLGLRTDHKTFTSDTSNVLHLQGLVFDTVTIVRVPTTINAADTTPDETYRQWTAIGQSHQESTRHAHLTPPQYRSLLEKTLTANRSHVQKGQSSIIDSVFGFMFGGSRGNSGRDAFDSPLPIPSKIKHGDDGSTSLTVDLDDLADTETPTSTADLVGVTMMGRAFFVTEKGYIGIGPADAEVGDVVVVLQGARVPFMLRSSQSADGAADGQSSFVLVGDCYIDEIMGGEDDDNTNSSKDEWTKAEKLQEFRIE